MGIGFLGTEARQWLVITCVLETESVFFSFFLLQEQQASLKAKLLSSTLETHFRICLQL